MTKSIVEKSPVRILERALGGGLGRGNIGVVLSRTGAGKTGFLIGLAIDKLLQNQRVLHISTKETVEHVIAYYDQLLHATAELLQLDNLLERRLAVERGRHVLVFNRETFTLAKLRQSIAFLREGADFQPDMLIMDGTPRFEYSEDWEIQGMRDLAREMDAEVWTCGNLHREGQEVDDRGVPREVAWHEEHLAVILSLASVGGRIRLQILKEHDTEQPASVSLELDPDTRLLRWR
ncbi:MAG TPA: hypothetical protein PLL30_04615 [Candidatus Krumholzibacteria bacterium]|nr:hypothetical protein [Candidatus Krumholzibacteria bacterium]HPD71052.1 hypothetical protein [Candidatus Krumholzibacteria bacterium]HRY39248.1 hypothetical protein [Candidatus Krumholzibacteria bacterium]